MQTTSFTCLRTATIYVVRRNICKAAFLWTSDRSNSHNHHASTVTSVPVVEQPEGSLQHKSTKTLSGGLSLVDRHYYTSRSHLVEWMSNNVIYEDERLLAVNKLSGTPVFGNMQSVSAEEDISAHGDRPVTIVSILSELRDMFKCPDLDIALGNPRFHSGVVILSKTTNSKTLLQKCIKTAETQKRPHLKYVAVTHGFPTSIKDSPEEMGFTRRKFGDRVLSVRVDRSNKTARQKGEEIVSVFVTTPLVGNSRTHSTLLKISVNKAKWDGIEAYLAEKLCSVLGDQLYSGRVNTVLGLPVHVEPNIAKQGTQSLSLPLKKKLGIHDDDLHHLPLHLHRHQVELNHFPTKQSSPLLITAPLPDYFKATIDKLKLHPHPSWNVI